MSKSKYFEFYTGEYRESLDNWIKKPHSTETYQKLFLLMDRTMKYAHDKGYIISDQYFHPKYIKVVEDKYIEFPYNGIIGVNRKLKDEKQSFDQMRRQNIYSSAVIALQTYTNFRNWDLNFVKENFDNGISILFPEDVVSYYGGVLKRGSLVYLNEFVQTKNKGDLEKLQKELGNNVIPFKQKDQIDDSSNAKGNTLQKSNGLSLLDESENYTKMHQEAGTSDRAAFLQMYFLPMVIFALSLLIPILAIVFSKG